MSVTRKITKYIPEILYGLDPGGECFDHGSIWTLMATVDGDHGRWQSHHTMVLMDPERNLWGLDYSLGLTEYQDPDIPWREEEEVEVYEMTAITETVIKYVKVKG